MPSHPRNTDHTHSTAALQVVEEPQHTHGFLNVPEELKRDPSWLPWKYAYRDGKQKKLPFQINGRIASTVEPQQWTTFDNALEAYELGTYDGIGFLFHNGNEFAGADIDDVTEENEFAREWVNRFDSYAERSPSGNGIHIIVKADMTEGTNRSEGELYTSGRFFTVTGDVIHDKPIRDAQDVAEQFYTHLRRKDSKPLEARAARKEVSGFDSPGLEDDDVLRLLQNARNGHENMVIYEGGGDFKSASERDQSLANRLSFFTQDEEQVERIMRGSGCVREKWNRHHAYLRDTIRKAIDGLANTYQPGSCKVTNLNEKRVSKKTVLEAGIRSLSRLCWGYDWGRFKGTGENPHWMRGYSCRDVVIALIQEASEHGRVSDDGEAIEVRVGRRKLALKAAISLRTVHKCVPHLEAEGWLEFVPPKNDGEPGVYRLKSASLHHVLSTSTVFVRKEELGGGGEGLRTPRLRWGYPLFEGTGENRAYVGYLDRLGKQNGAIIEHVLNAGGDIQARELAESLGKRVHDLRRRNLPKLLDAGIITVEDDLVRLTADWREALQRRREEDGEIAAERNARKSYEQDLTNYKEKKRVRGLHRAGLSVEEIARDTGIGFQRVLDHLRKADREPPLKGREEMSTTVEERAENAEEQRIERQRQKVGATAETFVSDKLDTPALLVAGGLRLGLLRGVYADAGGNPADVLPAAVRLGCRVERLPEYQNEQFVFPPRKPGRAA